PSVRGAQRPARRRHRSRRRLRPRRGDLQEGGGGRSADPPGPCRRRRRAARGDRPPRRPPRARTRRTRGIAMTRALLLLLALASEGCIVPLGSLALLGGRRPLEETTAEGPGRAKELLIDISHVITHTPSN